YFLRLGTVGFGGPVALVGYMHHDLVERRGWIAEEDVPTRQAYTMALVAPQERTAAASITSLARSAGSATSPIVGGVLLQGPLLALGLPFVVAGALKAAYDLTLWVVFRRVDSREVGEGAHG